MDLNRLHAKAHGMLALALRKLGRKEEAQEVLEAILAELEPLDVFARAELWSLDASEEQTAALRARIDGDAQALLELASDYMGVAQWEDAVSILRTWPGVAEEKPAHPMVYYYLAYCYDKAGEQELAESFNHLASEMDPAYAFPHRLEELDILSRALEMDPDDARACAYQGTLLYALRRYDEGIQAWKNSLALEQNAVVHRNLGKALWLYKKDLAGARAEYELAIAYSSSDYRLYADLFDILTEMNAPAEERLTLLAKAPQHGRLQARLAALLVELKRWEQAIEVLGAMRFDPYEGESLTRPAYYQAYVGRGLERYGRGDLPGALSDLEQALRYPRNLGVGKSHYAQDSKAFYWAGIVAEQMADPAKARVYWEEGASIRPWPQQDPASPRDGYEPGARYYKSLCLQRLGRSVEAAELF
ncbi:MAG: hypothetical protein FJW69_08300 [Actinobacteria bacterium]|nr:hypothetical protein [Actinomycetota bacterium]